MDPRYIDSTARLPSAASCPSVFPHHFFGGLIQFFLLLLCLSPCLTLNLSSLMRQRLSSLWGKRSVLLKQTRACATARAHTLTHVRTRTLTHKRHRQTVTHKSHLYYAEHQLADGGADYAVTLRQPTTPCWISAFKAQSQMSFQHINRELYIPKQWDPHTYSFFSTCSSHLVTVCGHFKR